MGNLCAHLHLISHLFAPKQLVEARLRLSSCKIIMKFLKYKSIYMAKDINFKCYYILKSLVRRCKVPSGCKHHWIFVMLCKRIESLILNILWNNECLSKNGYLSYRSRQFPKAFLLSDVCKELTLLCLC